mmetsp:Transcript_47372/g.115592  ORF Transcript_47372/g.115592 Transcript_47372/m.115592 type:complete len:430 (-) Transcript_47372:188-1477(-)
MRSLHVQLAYWFLPPDDSRMANTEPSFSAALVNDGRMGNGIDGGSAADGKIFHSKNTFPNITKVWMMGKGRQKYDENSERYFRQLFNYTFAQCPNIMKVCILDNHVHATWFISLLDDSTKARNTPNQNIVIPAERSNTGMKRMKESATKAMQHIADCCKWSNESTTTTKTLQNLRFLRFQSCAITEPMLEMLLWKIIPRGRRKGQSVDLRKLQCLEITRNNSIPSLRSIASRIHKGKEAQVVLRGKDNFPDAKRHMMMLSLWDTPPMDAIITPGDREEMDALLRLLKATSAVSLAGIGTNYLSLTGTYPPQIETRLRLNMAKSQVSELMKEKVRVCRIDGKRVTIPYSIPSVLKTIYDCSSIKYGHDPGFGSTDSTALYLFLRHNFETIIASSSKGTNDDHSNSRPDLVDRRKNKRMKMSTEGESCVIS